MPVRAEQITRQDIFSAENIYIDVLSPPADEKEKRKEN